MCDNVNVRSRKTRCSAVQVPLNGATFVEIAPFNPNRKALIFGVGTTGTIQWGFGDAPSLTTAIITNNNVLPIILTEDLHGAIVHGPIAVLGVGGSPSAHVIDCYYVED